MRLQHHHHLETTNTRMNNDNVTCKTRLVVALNNNKRLFSDHVSNRFEQNLLSMKSINKNDLEKHQFK